MADPHWKRLGDPAEKIGLDEFIQMFKAAVGISGPSLREDREILTDTPRGPKGADPFAPDTPPSSEFERIKKKTWNEPDFNKLGMTEFPRPGSLFGTQQGLVDVWKLMMDNPDFMIGALSADERFRIMLGQETIRKQKQAKDQFWNPREM